MAHILVAGLGDIGGALAARLLNEGHRVSGIRRRQQPVPGVDLYPQDLAEGALQLPPDLVELLYIVLTPTGRDEPAYRRAFLDAPLRLLDALAARQPMPPIVFVSSTAVYGDSVTEADEETAPQPDSFNGRVLLAAEQEISARSVTSAVRFSGIYGPGRERLLRQARAIAGGDSPPAARFSNRIHSTDCVGLLTTIGDGWLNGQIQPSVVIGTDSCPAINLEVLNYVGDQVGLSLNLDVPDIAPGKRLRSRYIGEGKYELVYPDYRVGYKR